MQKRTEWTFAASKLRLEYIDVTGIVNEIRPELERERRLPSDDIESQNRRAEPHEELVEAYIGYISSHLYMFDTEECEHWLIPEGRAWKSGHQTALIELSQLAHHIFQ